jgi:hypothetical protein
MASHARVNVEGSPTYRVPPSPLSPHVGKEENVTHKLCEHAADRTPGPAPRTGVRYLSYSPEVTGA